MFKPQATTVDGVLAKYEDAEQISPAYERVTIFSWRDMELLRDEIQQLRRQVGDGGNDG